MAAFVRYLRWATTLEENMTQLNLSGRQSNNTQQKPAAEHEDESIKNQTVGALGALAMFAAVIVIGSCSRSSTPVAVQQPIHPAAPVSAPAVTAPTPVPAPVLATAKAKKRRAATLSYVNREYGLSFNFPRNYQLKAQTKTTGNETQVGSTTTEPAEMNFVHPGGVALAAVEMPDNSYPGTDFKSGFVNVSVNPGMSSEQCSQFEVPESSTSPEVRAQVKIGVVDFHETENSSAAVMKQVDAKYYHVFSNGACYEFALGVGTGGDGATDEIKPIDRAGVFAKLEKILATVRFQPAVMPETMTGETQTRIDKIRIDKIQEPVPAVAGATPVDSSQTAEHDVSKPNF
jgi:hypothetical protein